MYNAIRESFRPLQNTDFDKILSLVSIEPWFVRSLIGSLDEACDVANWKNRQSPSFMLFESSYTNAENSRSTAMLASCLFCYQHLVLYSSQITVWGGPSLVYQSSFVMNLTPFFSRYLTIIALLFCRIWFPKHSMTIFRSIRSHLLILKFDFVLTSAQKSNRSSLHIYVYAVKACTQ